MSALSLAPNSTPPRMGLSPASCSPPSLPRTISNDGREIWEWAAKAGDYIHRQAKIKELRAGIRDLQPRCGTCYFWMKTGMCPRETRNAKGRREGPSMNGYPCNKHEEEAWIANLRDERLAEIAEREVELPPAC